MRMEKQMTLYGTFDTSCLATLYGDGLLQSGIPVFWVDADQCVDLKDTVMLKTRMEEYLKKGDYDKVKFINRIMSQKDFAEKNAYAEHFPEMLQIEHTDICNARCVMCNHYFTKNHGGSFLSLDVLSKVENYLPYVSYIALNGIGEPFLHPGILDIIESYEKYHIQLTTNTNLSVMNPELAAAVHRTFHDIQVSCDASNRESYESIRKGLKFDNFLRNAAMLREAGNTEICMAVVVMRQNILQLPDIVELAANLCFDKVVLLDLNTSRLLGNQDDTVRSFPHAAEYYIKKAGETAARRGIGFHSFDYVFQHDSASRKPPMQELEFINQHPQYPDDSLAEQLYRLYEKAGYLEINFDAAQTDYCRPGTYSCTGNCLFVENRPFISAKGDVYNCCSRRMHSMGNLNTTEFSDIWNGDALMKIRSVFYQGNLPYYCSGCSYLMSGLMSDRLKLGEINSDFYEDRYDQLRMKIIKERLGDICYV